MSERMLLRVEEVARMLGIGRREPPVLRIGRLVRIPRHALDEWVAERTELSA